MAFFVGLRSLLAGTLHCHPAGSMIDLASLTRHSRIWLHCQISPAARPASLLSRLRHQSGAGSAPQTSKTGPTDTIRPGTA